MVAERVQHRLDALAEGRDRRIGHDATLLVRDQAVVLLVMAAAFGHVLVGGNPAAVGEFLGTVLQVISLALGTVAGIVATVQNFLRRRTA